MSGLKYDLIVHPGADVSDIGITYEGASGMEVSLDGDLIVHTPAGDLTETEFTGAAHCNECARPFQATQPTEDYCGCRH